MKQIIALRNWLARWWLVILGVCALTILASVFMVGREGGKIQQAIHDNPIIPKSKARAMTEKSAKDSTKAVVATKIAAKAIQKAAKDSTRAVVAETKADSLQALHEKIPASAAGPIGDVQRFLTDYASPDSTGH